MQRPDVDGHPTIGGGAVIRLSKQGLADVKKGLERLGQTTVALTPIMQELVKVLAEMGEPVEPEVTAHLGMTPDGGYKAPDEESFPIRPGAGTKQDWHE